MASGRILFQNKHRAAIAERAKRRYYEQQRSRSNDNVLVE